MTPAKLLKSIFFIEILQGLGVTFKHMFVKSVTVQYPHEKPVLPPSFRGMLCLLRYEDGTDKCVGCALCEAACPSHTILVVGSEEERHPLKRYAKEFYIDITRCVFCGFCVEACPVDALGMTQEYEFSTANKRDLVLDKPTLLAIGDKGFPNRPPKPAFLTSCEGDQFLEAAKAKGYPMNKGVR
jgi:NADH-quinone oxidoreductase subunit I